MKIGNNLSLPKKIVFMGEFDCDKMMNCCKEGWVRISEAGENRG